MLALALASGCGHPTEVGDDPDACTLTAIAGDGILVHSCYRHCPDGAEAFAKANGEVFARKWLCGGRLS